MKNVYILKGITWTVLVALGISSINAQPIGGTSNTATPAVSGTATGTGRAGEFNINNTSSLTHALMGKTDGPGTGVFGWTTATTGFGTGVIGQSAAVSGTGVFGLATGSTGLNYGIYGQTYSTNGFAGYFVGRGYFSSRVGIGTTSPTHMLHVQTSNAHAIRGQTSQAGATAIYGYATSASGFPVGVSGRADAPTGTGVYGIAAHGSGVNYAVYALTNSANGYAGYFQGGKNYFSGNTGFGVTNPMYPVHVSSGTNTGLYVTNTATTGTTPAVIVNNDSTDNSAVGFLSTMSSAGSGIYSAAIKGVNNGTANDRVGVWGDAQGQGTGVYGTTLGANGRGVYGRSTGSSGIGVYGYSLGEQGRGVSGIAVETSSVSYGVHGAAISTAGYGVYGIAPFYGVYGEASSLNGTSYGVYGHAMSTNGFAGYFDGAVGVTGNLSKGGGSFKIDHPLDPANKYLYHSFVESPDMMNIYNGNVVTDAQGFASITLPEWFETLNRDFRYQLTIVDETNSAEFVHAKVVQKIRGNQFVIRTSQPHVEVSWMVTGIRHDPYAEQYRIPVEQDKPANERGRYLHPELYGQPKENSVNLPPR
ncbi:MAG: hypothetical protein KIT45_11440 [Fimbriimonadia bacterium]|nr:hypothetical protein [Fimbriimonadia bacterium]